MDAFLDFLTNLLTFIESYLTSALPDHTLVYADTVVRQFIPLLTEYIDFFLGA